MELSRTLFGWMLLPALVLAQELGGTGRTHDWMLSRRVRDAVQAPVFLVGGLNATNVAEAIAVVRPSGLDICSGVRTDDQLDPTRLREFFDAVRGGELKAMAAAALV
jgi:phosphoribosylanthranilate isomerase